MNILIVSQYFWPEGFRINTIADSLQGADCRVTVLTAQPNYPDGKTFPGYSAWRAGAEVHPSGYPVFRVPIVPRGSGGAVRLALNYISFVVTSISIGAWQLRKSQVDVVFIYGTSPILQALTGLFFGAVKRAPVVLWVQDLWPESLSSTGYVRNRFILGCVERLVGWIYRTCDLVLVQSRSFAARVKSMSGATPVDYYPNPGDVEDRPDTTKASGDTLLPAGFNVTFAGNLGTVQSVETMLDAAEQLRSADVNLVILGSGSRLGWMAEQVAARSLSNVHLLGRREPHVAIDAMKHSDALLITLNDSEGLNRTVPSKLVTYLGAGRPIIASMNGEGADIVRASGAGLVCKAEDAARLAALVQSLKDLPQSERDAMGAAGRRWYDEHYDLTKLTRTLIGYFESARRLWAAKREASE